MCNLILTYVFLLSVLLNHPHDNSVSTKECYSYYICTHNVTLPKNGSCFLDSTPQIRQLTSLCNKPPNIAVTMVLFPFGPEIKITLPDKT